MIKIGIDAKQFAKAQKLLEKFPEQVNIAAAVSINRTLTTVKKETSVAIRKNYVINARDIKKSMTHKRADRRTLRGLIKTVGNPLPLTKFKVNRPGQGTNFNKIGNVAEDISADRRRRKKRNPIKVQVMKRRPMAPLRAGALFIPRGRHSGLVRRIHNRGRYPLTIPSGPSVPQMFGAERTLEQLEPIAQEILNERFQHEIEHRMSIRGL